jgi:hypothetical protein
MKPEHILVEQQDGIKYNAYTLSYELNMSAKTHLPDSK